MLGFYGKVEGGQPVPTSNEDACRPEKALKSESPYAPVFHTEIGGVVKYFQLRQGGSRITLVATNREGTTVCGGNVLQITSDGKIALICGVGDKSGLSLGLSRRVNTCDF